MNTQILGGFKTGMDRSSRRGGKDGAQRLWLLQNGYINERGEVIPRPGLQHVATVTNSAGLYGWQGQLHVFHGEDDFVDPGNPLVKGHVVRYPLPPPAALTITGAVQGYIGDVVDTTYAVAGGVLPYGAVTISAGALPTGLSMDASGHVTGTLTTSGTFNWTVAVTDADQTTATLVQSLTVSKPRVAYFDGTGDYLNAPIALPIIATGDFTVQARISPTSTNSMGIVSARNTNIRGWVAQFSGGGAITWRQSMNGGVIDAQYNIPPGGVIPLNTLTHVAVTRKGDLFTIWVNGVAVSSATHAGSIDETSVTSLVVGSAYGATLEALFIGHMEWMTMNIGTCLYDAPFTPPTNSVQVPSPSVRLAFNEPIGSTTFADTGSLGLTWTTNGNVVIVEYPY